MLSFKAQHFEALSSLPWCRNLWTSLYFNNEHSLKKNFYPSIKIYIKTLIFLCAHSGAAFKTWHYACAPRKEKQQAKKKTKRTCAVYWWLIIWVKVITLYPHFYFFLFITLNVSESEKFHYSMYKNTEAEAT